MVDLEAIKRYHERVDARLAERGIRFSGFRFDINEKHDKLGRFAPKNGSGGGKTAEEMTKADIQVRGPQGARGYVRQYMKAHPEARKQIKADAKKYADAMKRVKNFQKDHPNAQAGTYSADTGEPVNVDSGYCVTFHQNHKVGDEYGGYDDRTYALMCAVTKHELGSDDVYIGYYGNPEISFNCKNYQQAKKFCVAHNQHSIYDARRHCLWKNTEGWDETYNPISGEGSYKDDKD